MHKRLYDYIPEMGILSETQFGFRKGHSTLDAVHSLCDTVNKCFAGGVIPLTALVILKKRLMQWILKFYSNINNPLEFVLAI